VYPVAFCIGTVPVSSFGLCLALGSLFSCWYGQRWVRRAGFPPRYVWHVYGWMMVAGLLGAKLWYAVESAARGNGTFAAALLERSGVTFCGGLLGGAASILTKGWIDEVPPLKLLDAFAPIVALGEAIGRIGCFLVGDDYGVPTSLPWGTAFPLGHPATTERVHPTQLYESFWALAMTAFLSRRVEKSRSLFGEYLILEGVGRFVVEFVRTNPPTLGLLTIYQLAALVWILVGAALLYRARLLPAIHRVRVR
jgi:phosphatidylglycerol:prolipoprotein diacylglycerol transferase